MRQSGYAARLLEQRRQDRRATVSVTEDIIRQLTVDCFCIALHELYGFSHDRLKRLIDRTCELYTHFAHTQLFETGVGLTREARKETTEDPARAELDAMLHDAVGEPFEDFYTRYPMFPPPTY